MLRIVITTVSLGECHDVIGTLALKVSSGDSPSNQKQFFGQSATKLVFFASLRGVWIEFGQQPALAKCFALYSHSEVHHVSQSQQTGLNVCLEIHGIRLKGFPFLKRFKFRTERKIEWEIEQKTE